MPHPGYYLSRVALYRRRKLCTSSRLVVRKNSLTATCVGARLGLAVPLAAAMARARCPARPATVLLVRLSMGVVVVRLARGMPLAVLLPLLGAMLLGEVGDTVPNPMHPVGQRILTALHLGLDLLAERPSG